MNLPETPDAPSAAESPAPPKVLLQIVHDGTGVAVVSHLPPLKILELFCALMPDAFAAVAQQAQQAQGPRLVKPNQGIINRLRNGRGR